MGPEGAGCGLTLGSSQHLVPAKLLKDGEQTVALWLRIRRQDQDESPVRLS